MKRKIINLLLCIFIANACAAQVTPRIKHPAVSAFAANKAIITPEKIEFFIIEVSMVNVN